MTLFWIIASLMVVVALALVLPALLGRRAQDPLDPTESINLANHREQLLELTNALERGEISQAEFSAARGEIGNSLIVELSLPGATKVSRQPVDNTLAIVIAGLIPVASVALYLWLGSTVSLSPPDEIVRVDEQSPSVEAMVAGLAEKLRDQPDDPEGWLMLARSYSVMERYPEARDAYAEAHALIGDQAQLLVDYAEVIALTDDDRLTGKATELLTTALTLEPDNQKGLWLAGFAARQNGDDERAVNLWQKLALHLTAGSEELVMVEDMITQAGGTPSGEPTADVTPQPSAAAIEVTVSLAPHLASRVTGDETLFIFARALNGPPMPLAIQRHRASELPLVVTLDDTMHMLPAFKLSGFPTVSVGARISRTGNATPSSGDLQGLVSPVEVSDGQPVNLIIKEIVE